VLKNGTLYGILSVPLVAFCVCGYILWHWGNAEVYGVVFLLDAPAAFGTFLRLRNDSKFWYRRRTPIPRENPLYPRTIDLATKMGVPHHDLYVADATLMVKRKAVGAVNTGIRRHSIMLSDYFLRALNQEEQDAVIAHELAHTKQSHALTSIVINLGYYFAGWNLFFFSAIPNLQTSNLSKSWVSNIAGAGIFLFLGGIIIVRPYLAMKNQTEADEIAVNILGSGDSLISGMKKLIESPEIMADQKKYRMAHQSLYGRMVKIQNLSRSLAARNLAHNDSA
jgi:Zn-dependent protease with chaperone function